MAIVKTRVTIDIEVEVGNFGSEWTVGSLQKDAKRALETALGHLVTGSLKSGIKFCNVQPKGLTVVFDDKE